jgi:hypothetical protein
MTDYLARLKAKIGKISYSQEPSKPSKVDFEPFEGNSGAHVSEDDGSLNAALAGSARPEPRGGSYPAPCIIREPPFGSDGVPLRYRAAWQTLLAQCPHGMRTIVWEAAIYDTALLFSDFGAELARLDWTACDLFDAPHRGTEGGLVWFIKGSPVVTIGRTVAFTQDGRLYRSK